MTEDERLAAPESGYINWHRFMLLPLLLAPLCCAAADPHVHGVATLQIAVDGKRLQLHLESPLDSLLGFEHMPRTAQQKSAVRSMERQLRQAEKLFYPSPRAACSLQSVSLESPVLKAEKHQEAHDHADLDGKFVFTCAKPEELRTIEVRLFEAFPGLRQLKTEAATPRGQKAATLTPKQRKISW